MIDDIKMNGVRIYHLCGGKKEELESIISTTILFFGGLGHDQSSFNPFTHGLIPSYMEFANI